MRQESTGQMDRGWILRALAGSFPKLNRYHQPTSLSVLARAHKLFLNQPPRGKNVQLRGCSLAGSHLCDHKGEGGGGSLGLDRTGGYQAAGLRVVQQGSWQSLAVRKNHCWVPQGEKGPDVLMPFPERCWPLATEKLAYTESARTLIAQHHIPTVP